MRSSIRIKRVSRNFYPGGPTSGQFRGLSIISLWVDVKMLLVSHKLAETSQFFQDCDHSPRSVDLYTFGWTLGPPILSPPPPMLARLPNVDASQTVIKQVTLT